MAQKIVSYTNLKSFWAEIQKWFLVNIDILFKNDEMLEETIGNPASADYEEAVIDENGNIVQLEVGKAPTGLYKTIYDLEKRLSNLENTDFTTLDTSDDSDYENI